MSKAGIVAALAAVISIGIVSTISSTKKFDGPAKSRRQDAVDAAIQEFERVNSPGNLADPVEYWRVAAGVELSDSQSKKLDWCGGFYVWALKMAGLATDLFWNLNGSGFQSAHLQPTNSPLPGDLAYFNKNQHHAMVESIDGDTVNLINGNGGGKGITRTSVDKSKVDGFFSIESLLS